MQKKHEHKHGILSKELVTAIDADAKENYRTRSQQINMILTEYYKTKLTTEKPSK